MKKILTTILVCILFANINFASDIANPDVQYDVYYVSTTGNNSNNGKSWNSALADVQTAIDKAAASASDGKPSQVWIARGTYKHGSYMTMKNNVEIYGGFAGTEKALSERVSGNETILDGEGNDVVFYNSDLNPSAKLDSVTIQNGYASQNGGGGMYNYYASPTLTNCIFSKNTASVYGGAMYNIGSTPVLTNCTFTKNECHLAGGGILNGESSPILTNCTFIENTASVYGGGISNYANSNPTLTNCTFSGNTAEDGGGIFNSSNNPTLINCTFSGNVATNGGGMYNFYANPTLMNCTFIENTVSHMAGGMYNTDSNPVLTNCTFTKNEGRFSGGGILNKDSNPTLTNCTFSGNTAEEGGGMFNSSNNPTLINCTFSGNVATNGGGMYNCNSSATLVNCTFSKNTANYSGGISNYIYYDLVTNMTMTNCIVWGNNGGEIYEIYNDGNSSFLTLTNCVVKGGYDGGTNIITADPKLGELGDNGGFVQTIPVLAGSSAIAKGATGVNVPTTDARGVARSTPCTIGAYEYDGTSPVIVAPTSCTVAVSKTSVDAGSEFTITATANGTAPLTYTLYRSNGTKLAEQTSNVFKVTESTAGSYSYYVIAKNASGSKQSANTTVTVKAVIVAPTSCTVAVSKTSVDAGSEFTITATANGTAPLTYTLYRSNGTKLAEQTSNVFKVTESTAGSYSYYVIAKNASGSKQSANTTVTVKAVIVAPTSCTVAVSKTSVDAGSEFTITATANGTAPLTYTLYRSNGTKLAEQTSNVFKVTESTAGSYSYYVIAKNASGSKQSANTKITVNTVVSDVYYVSTTGNNSNDGKSWNSALADVQTAIDAAAKSATNDHPIQVWIARGTYKHGSSMTMKNNVEIYGGFAGTEKALSERVSGNETILDGEGAEYVFRNSSLIGSGKLDSVTISNGGIYIECVRSELTNCTFSGNSGKGVFVRDYSSPTLINCTFSGNSGVGVYNDFYSSATLINCTFSGNSGVGVYNNFDSSATLINCTFSENSGGGVYNSAYSSATLINCILWGNGKTEVYNDETSSLTFTNCVVKGGYDGGTNIITEDPMLGELGNYGGFVQTIPVLAGSSAIAKGASGVNVPTTDARGVARSTPCTIGAYEYDGSDPVVAPPTSCTITISKTSVDVGSEFTITATATATTSLTYTLYRSNGTKLAEQRSNVFKLIEPTAGSYSYYVIARNSAGSKQSANKAIVVNALIIGDVYYVSTTGNNSNDGKSWNSALADVQTAIDKAAASASDGNQSQVWIARGTYKHGSSMTMKNNVEIYGGFAGTEKALSERVSGNETILDGENSYSVFRNEYTPTDPLTNRAKLDSVTIQNGYVYGYYDGPDNPSSGGGMYNICASPTLTNCTFRNNTADHFGGGMYNDGSSSPTVTNCTFSENIGCDYGGGMYNDYQSSPIVTNCTFAKNGTWFYEGGGIYGGSPTLVNCIFWGNSGGEISDVSNSAILTNCVVKGGYDGGTNIITEDPKLGELGNYGGFVQTIPVLAGSSAIAKGTTGVNVPTTDARGVARSTPCTIGAYEYSISFKLTVQDGTGSGSYTAGEVVTITANPAPSGMVFDKWVGDVETVANVKSSSTTLTVSNKNVAISASYTLIPRTISISGGTGSGSYTAGEVVTITANPAPDGMVFDKWVGDVANIADVNSASTTLTVPAGNLNISATYKEKPALVDPFGEPVVYPNIAMTVLGKVDFFGENPPSDSVVAAFVGNELRAKSSVVMLENVPFVMLTVNVASDGETIKFKIWNPQDDVVSDAVSACTLSAVSGGMAGSMDNPFKIAFENAIPLDLSLNTGWNQISINLGLNDFSIRNVFADIISDVELIQGNGKSFNPAWPDALNTLKTFDNAAGFWVKMKNGNYTQLSGKRLDLSSSPISLKTGWNNIAYLPASEGSIREVLATALASGKIERIINASGTFIPTMPDLLNSLSKMKPGVGYWVKATSDVTINYEEPSPQPKARMMLKMARGISDPFSEPVVYPNIAMTVLADVQLNGSAIPANSIVAVFAGEELRAKSAVIELGGQTIANLTVQVKTNGEALTFKVWNAESGVLYDVKSLSIPAEMGGMPYSYPDSLLLINVTTSAPSTGFKKWAEDNSLSGDFARADAKPHSDGITNLEKYAFGLDASKATSYAAQSLFVQTNNGTSASFQFPVNKNASDVAVKVLVSEDLVNWTEGSATLTGEEGDFNLYKVEQTLPAGKKLFFKLKVEQK